MGAFGGIPICHGSGGMTAHYRFGARGPAATILTGLFYIALAVIFRGSASAFLHRIPTTVLAAMLFYVGAFHACLVKDLREKIDFAIAGIMGCIAITTGNLAYALLSGIACETARNYSPVFTRSNTE